ncbi:hypothetical protein AGOR_G00102630 [Albula goreensis]|uniref:Dynamin N-terminal domain-containing protein n=1 Tax=Albula goreensis TaxID=1534307 RepID=A0A8T3DCY1_9TELE|nr:hypothetical protein AGOR_G00102630 [Albula goreensis]
MADSGPSNENAGPTPMAESGPSHENAGLEKGKRQNPENEDNSPRKKVKKKKSASSELKTCEEQLKQAKQTASQVYNKLTEASCQNKSFIEKVAELLDFNPNNKIYIGLFGRTGTGKSSLINALVKENHLLPSGSLHACTSVFVHVQSDATSNKYKVEIEFLSESEWDSDLRNLLDILSDTKDPKDTNENQGDSEDDNMERMAREKITAIYGKDALNKTHNELIGTNRFPEIAEKFRKPQSFKTAKELADAIDPYIRSGDDEGQKFWPVVKQVTITLPKTSDLPQGVVLVDIPGAGDANKQRDEMWKECLSMCSSVWIVEETNRVLSQKIPKEIIHNTLRTVGGGGECHNITFVCTQTDTMKKLEMKSLIKIHKLTDEKLGISASKGSPEYDRQLKRGCIKFQNKRVKDSISKLFEDKAKKLLTGDADDSDGLFDVYTVSSEEFWENAEPGNPTLDINETELPSLEEHIKELYISHYVKEVKEYVSDVSGVILLLLFSKDVNPPKVQEFLDKELNRLKKKLRADNGICTNLNKSLSTDIKTFENKLTEGMKMAEKDGLNIATSKVLQPSWKKGGHYQTLRAMCKHDGYFRSGKGELFDLNYALSLPMYKKIEEKDTFLNTFSVAGSKHLRTSIKGEFASFQENFITDTLLEAFKNEQKKYLRLVYIRTQQRKLLKDLEKEMLQRKKQIYNSLSDSIRDTMKPTYQECSGIRGPNTLRSIQEKLKTKVESSKQHMFQLAKDDMLQQLRDLQEYLVTEIEKKMNTTLGVALNGKSADLTDLADLSEELETMKKLCVDLHLRVF